MQPGLLGCSNPARYLDRGYHEFKAVINSFSIPRKKAEITPPQCVYQLYMNIKERDWKGIYNLKIHTLLARSLAGLELP